MEIIYKSLICLLLTILWFKFSEFGCEKKNAREKSARSFFTMSISLHCIRIWIEFMELRPGNGQMIHTVSMFIHGKTTDTAL